MKIAVLMTCYNRAETTLRALEALHNAAKGLECDVFLVDDASPDGTGAKVRERFPHIHVIEGTGRLFFGPRECASHGRRQQRAVNMTSICG